MCDYEVDWSPPSLYQLCLYKTAKHIVGKTIDPNNLNVEQVEGFHVVINSFHRLKLPRTVKRDLARTTNMMRSAMIKWLKIMFAKWKLMIRTEDYIANIQWGTFGDLNTANTIRSLYWAEKLPLRLRRGTFIILSNYCIDDCIRHFFPKIAHIPSVTFLAPMIESFSTTVDHILPIYWWFYLHNRREEIINYFRTIECYNVYDESFAIEENMFIFSVHNRSYAATKYFWDSLDSNSKERTIRTLYQKRIGIDIFYHINMSVHLVMFLWSQFCIYKLCNYLIQILKWPEIRNKLANWPWQDIFIRTTYRAMDKFEYRDYKEIAENLVLTLGTNFKKRTHSNCRQLFFDFWPQCPVEIKRQIDYFQIFDVLLQYGHIEMFNTMLNTETFTEDDREHILKELARASVFEIKYFPENVYKVVKKMCVELQCTDEERRQLKLCINRVVDFDAE